jgi:hypothetical protein
MAEKHRRKSKDCCDCNGASSTPKKIWNWTWLSFKLSIVFIIVFILLNLAIGGRDWWETTFG